MGRSKDEMATAQILLAQAARGRIFFRILVLGAYLWKISVDTNRLIKMKTAEGVMQKSAQQVLLIINFRIENDD